MGGLLHLVQRRGLMERAVRNVKAHPSTASVRTASVFLFLFSLLAYYIYVSKDYYYYYYYYYYHYYYYYYNDRSLQLMITE